MIFDGDGKTDVAVYDTVTGDWSVIGSSAGPFGRKWGGPGFAPAPGDYGGKGMSNIAIYEIATFEFFVAPIVLPPPLTSAPASGASSVVADVDPADVVPAPADYDGDGRADQALYQKKKGKWRFRLSSTGATFNFTGIGGTGWLATPGDFDGDGKIDAGAYRKSTGSWRHQSSSTGLKTTLPTLGGSGLVPVVGLRP